MNILASYKWMREYLKTDLSAEEFAKKTTAAGNSVERMDAMDERFAHMVVGDVLAVKPHPNADKLRLADVKIGAKKVEIVCGGANLKEGQKVVVALPGAKVRWHGTGDLIELKPTEIRGVKSAGMICAASEIGFEKLPQDEKGIWDLTDLVDAKAGMPLATALGLEGDMLFDVEVTTNRPDCMAIVGQAREGSAVTGGKFLWKGSEVKSPKGAGKLSIKVEDKLLCKKYEAVRLDGVKVGPSPWWLQARLLLSGHRPINNVVDVTNYVLHELGQPLHAFDADKLDGGIVVRRAKKGETMMALDGKEYPLADTMLVIADSKKPIAIAGVMGGQGTGTTEATTSVILESATFDPVSVRKTSRALNLSSDSSQLFEKGLSTQTTSAALARAVELILEIAGGHVASEVASLRSEPYKAPHFPFSPEKAAALIGVAIPEKTMTGMLERLGFELKKNKHGYDVTVPAWRDHDVEDSRDFVEEIARLFGYANVPSRLPSGELASTLEDPAIVWERCAKESLRAAGATETYGMSFVSGQQLERYGIDRETAVKIQNPLASDQEYLRPSLVPSMLTTVEANQRQFPDELLFELAPTYAARKDDIPEHRLQLVVAAYEKDGAMAFRKAKGVLERLMRELGVKRWRLERPDVSPPARGGARGGGSLALMHETRSATIWVGDHAHIGTLAEVAPLVSTAFGLEVRTVLVTLDFESLVPHCSNSKSYIPIPLYPAVKRDIAIIVPERVEFSAIEIELKKSSPLLRVVELFDIYRGKGVEEGKKSLAMHMEFRDEQKTLESAVVDGEMKKLSDLLTKHFSAILRA